MDVYVIGQLTGLYYDIGLHYNTETKKMHYMMDVVREEVSERAKHVLRLSNFDVHMIMLAKKKDGYELVEGRRWA